MRYVIQGRDGGYYTEVKITGSRDCIELDGTGNKYVHARPLFVPKFDGREPNDASKFHEKQAAIDMMTNEFLSDPKAFEGAEVVEFPFDGY
jgi:hypothetical protein